MDGVKDTKKKKNKSLGFDPPLVGAYNNRKHLKFWEISSKSEVFDFSEGQKPPITGVYNNRKKLKFWESALFSG